MHDLGEEGGARVNQSAPPVARVQTRHDGNSELLMLARSLASAYGERAEPAFAFGANLFHW